jgi:hypothetical protein
LRISSSFGTDFWRHAESVAVYPASSMYPGV